MELLAKDTVTYSPSSDTPYLLPRCSLSTTAFAPVLSLLSALSSLRLSPFVPRPTTTMDQKILEASAKHPQPGKVFQYGTAGVSLTQGPRFSCGRVGPSNQVLTMLVVPHESVRQLKLPVPYHCWPASALLALNES